MAPMSMTEINNMFACCRCEGAVEHAGGGDAAREGLRLTRGILQDTIPRRTGPLRQAAATTASAP